MCCMRRVLCEACAAVVTWVTFLFCERTWARRRLATPTHLYMQAYAMHRVVQRILFSEMSFLNPAHPCVLSVFSSHQPLRHEQCCYMAVCKAAGPCQAKPVMILVQCTTLVLHRESFAVHAVVLYYTALATLRCVTWSSMLEASTVTHVHLCHDLCLHSSM